MLELNGARFYSIPEAAKDAAVPYTTLFRWVKGQGFGSIKFELAQDSISKRYYIADHSVKALTAYLKQHVTSVQRIQTRRIKKTS